MTASSMHSSVAYDLHRHHEVGGNISGCILKAFVAADKGDAHPVLVIVQFIKKRKYVEQPLDGRRIDKFEAERDGRILSWAQTVRFYLLQKRHIDHARIFGQRTPR